MSIRQLQGIVDELKEESKTSPESDAEYHVVYAAQIGRAHV